MPLLLLPILQRTSRCAVIPLLCGCVGAIEETAPAFVRGGLVLVGAEGVGGTPLPGDRMFVSKEWSPGEEVDLPSGIWRAPRRSDCIPLFSTDLPDSSRLIAQGGEPADVALAFSPDGERLAIGTSDGELRVVQVFTGDTLVHRIFAEALVKEVAWSTDGGTLYLAEQSPDAYLWSLDAETLKTRWSVRLAEEVGSSPLPPGDDLYGVYTLPAAQGLHVLPGGDLIVAVVHAWNEDDRRMNRSRILRFGPDGSLHAAWPSKGPADATLLHPAVEPDAGLLAVSVGRSADGPPPPDLPVNGVQILNLDDLTPAGSFRVEPLAPWYGTVFAWEAVDIEAMEGTNGLEGRLLVGLGDGRLFLHPLYGGPDVQVDLGTPRVYGGVPMAASVGFGRFVHGEALVQTARADIPFGARSPVTRPPTTHPGENSLWSFDSEGQLLWTWKGPHNLTGLTVAPDGRTVVVGAGTRVSDDRRDLFGALVFDLGRAGSGLDRLAAICPTEGPVFFRQAVSVDGFIAVATHPFLDASGSIQGTDRVVVFR